jgi:alkylation response protein AidB-like acyl-CoA dehydrogenase
MDFAYTAAEDAFRQALRAWLEPTLREHRAVWGEKKDEFTQHPSSPASLAWHKRLYAGGWVGLHWPREYGGRGASLMQQVIFTEECMRLGAPPASEGSVHGDAASAARGGRRGATRGCAKDVGVVIPRGRR